MRPKCKFCGKEIHEDHYFITKHGSTCLECKEKIKNEIHSFRAICNSMHPDFDRTRGKVD